MKPGASAVIILLLALAADPQSAGEPDLLTVTAHMVGSCGDPQASAPMQLAQSSGQYCLKQSAFINQTDVASAAIEQERDFPLSVALTLRDAAAQRVFELTSKSIGMQIGVVVNGRLLSVATIPAPSRSVRIRGALTQDEALSIVRAFRDGAVSKTAPPPLPAAKQDSGEPDSAGRYLPGRRGITSPILLRKVEPEYTPEARARGIQGVVILTVVILVDGTLDDIRVIRSLDSGLDAKAIEAVRGWRFRPARKDGTPIEMKVQIEVNFRL